MTPVKIDATALAKDALQAFDDVNGPQPPGFRPAHAKGILIAGRFAPSPSAVSLTRAPHVQRPSTPVSVRFSDTTGIPAIPDNDPNASPRGIAIRFHLAEHVHTDIIAHSVDAFPVRTGEEFVEFLRAVHASGPGAPNPTPIEAFLATHPAALAFVQTPKPVPRSFATESFFALNAHRFTNRGDVSRYGRYRIRPEGNNEYLDASDVAKAAPNFLFDDITQRVAAGPVRMRILVQLAESGDVTNDSTVQWPDDRPEVSFGTIELTQVIPNNDAEQRQIIFDPIPRVDGMDASDDPLMEFRATTYLMSGRRRRAAGPR
jgi:catalase